MTQGTTEVALKRLKEEAQMELFEKESALLMYAQILLLGHFLKGCQVTSTLSNSLESTFR